MVSASNKLAIKVRLMRSDCIRYYQAAEMFQRHKMFKLVTFKDGLSKSFENQILATWVIDLCRNSDCRD